MQKKAPKCNIQTEVLGVTELLAQEYEIEKKALGACNTFWA